MPPGPFEQNTLAPRRDVEKPPLLFCRCVGFLVTIIWGIAQISQDIDYDRPRRDVMASGASRSPAMDHDDL